jgi:hypothetical protein
MENGAKGCEVCSQHITLLVLAIIFQFAIRFLMLFIRLTGDC